MILSTMATASIEEVAATKCAPLWFQIYVLSRRDVTAALIKEAERLGYKALLVTVDAPRLGKSLTWATFYQIDPEAESREAMAVETYHPNLDASFS